MATYLNGCTGCDTCNSCVACEECNKCQKCDTCQVTCNQAEVLVKPGDCGWLGELLGNFSFSPSPTKDMTLIGPEDGMFNKESWDAIIDYYNKGAGLGKIVHFFASDIPTSTVAAVSPFSAAEFNRVAAAVGTNLRVNPGDLILGSYFTALENAVSNLTGDDGACDKCNEGCDCEGAITSKCVQCLTCDECQSCVTGVTDAKGCMEYCCDCDTCQSTCQVSCQSSCQISCQSEAPATPVTPTG